MVHFDIYFGVTVYFVFGDMLSIDAAYRKINYNTPLVIFSGVTHHNQSIVFGSAIVGDETEDTYVWLLQNFVDALGEKVSVSVITGEDLAMRNAIRRVFQKHIIVYVLDIKYETPLTT